MLFASIKLVYQHFPTFHLVSTFLNAKLLGSLPTCSVYSTQVAVPVWRPTFYLLVDLYKWMHEYSAYEEKVKTDDTVDMCTD